MILTRSLCCLVIGIQLRLVVSFTPATSPLGYSTKGHLCLPSNTIRAFHAHLGAVEQSPSQGYLDRDVQVNQRLIGWRYSLLSLLLGAFLGASVLLGGTPALAAIDGKYDGFAEYAKENQMEQSDVACFINKCGDQTKALFSNPRGIKESPA